MESKMFHLVSSDFAKAAVVAVAAGFFLPIIVAVQTPGFSVFSTDWIAILHVGIDGGVVGFAGYLFKSFFSDSEGKVLGKIG